MKQKSTKQPIKPIRKGEINLGPDAPYIIRAFRAVSKLVPAQVHGVRVYYLIVGSPTNPGRDCIMKVTVGPNIHGARLVVLNASPAHDPMAGDPLLASGPGRASQVTNSVIESVMRQCHMLPGARFACRELARATVYTPSLNMAHFCKAMRVISASDLPTLAKRLASIGVAVAYCADGLRLKGDAWKTLDSTKAFTGEGEDICCTSHGVHLTNYNGRNRLALLGLEAYVALGKAWVYGDRLSCHCEPGTRANPRLQVLLPMVSGDELRGLLLESVMGTPTSRTASVWDLSQVILPNGKRMLAGTNRTAVIGVKIGEVKHGLINGGTDGRPFRSWFGSQAIKALAEDSRAPFDPWTPTRHERRRTSLYTYKRTLDASEPIRWLTQNMIGYNAPKRQPTFEPED